MKLTGLSGNAGVRVHKTGCADIKRDARTMTVISDPEQDWASREQYGLDYWADINAEHDGEEDFEPYVFEDITFLPCTHGLTVR